MGTMTDLTNAQAQLIAAAAIKEHIARAALAESERLGQLANAVMDVAARVAVLQRGPSGTRPTTYVRVVCYCGAPIQDAQCELCKRIHANYIT